MIRTFRSLRVRNYRLFASGQVVSLTGTWMQRVGQDWLVTQLTHTSGTALGITTGLQFLPVLLFGLYGGVIADRFPKRRLLVATQSTMAALALVLGLLVVTGEVRLWEVYLLAFGTGMCTAVDNPTRQAFVAEMVGADEVVNAVGLNSATFNLARIVGPALGGLMIAVLGGRTGPLFLLNASSYGAVLACLWAMRESELFDPGRRVARATGQLRAGLAYVRHRPLLYLPSILVGVVGTLGFNFQITLVLIDRSVFHLGAGAYGLLSATLAVGSLGGAIVAARRTRPTARLLVGAALAFGAFEVLAGSMPSYLALALMLVPTGVASLSFTATANTSVQLASDPAMRGRVMGLYMLVFLGGTPIGAPLVGWLASAAGPRWSLWIGGGASALAALGVAAVLAFQGGSRPGAEALGEGEGPPEVARPLVAASGLVAAQGLAGGGAGATGAGDSTAA
ncbi:MAG: MFS transporter [Candidatus Dormibacteria bacterium]